MLQADVDPDEVLAGLHKTMSAKGHMRLYVAVLRGVLRILNTKSDTDSATVYIAKESDIKVLTNTIESAFKELDAENEYTTKVDTTLIGGFIIKSNNTILDRCYKTALTKLYRAATKQPFDFRDSIP